MIAVCFLGVLAAAGRVMTAGNVVGGEVSLWALILETGGVLFVAGLAVFFRYIRNLLPVPIFLAWGILFTPALKGDTWQQDGLAARSLRSSLAPSAAAVSFNGAVSSGVSVTPGPHEAPRVAGRRGAPLIFPRAENRRNIVLLILEGIPAVHLEQVQEETGVTFPVKMPYLSRTAERGLITPHTAAHNRQTIRGLYPIMTRDYPFRPLCRPSRQIILYSGDSTEVPSCPPRYQAEPFPGAPHSAVPAPGS